jgi:hypothetical protein
MWPLPKFNHCARNWQITLVMVRMCWSVFECASSYSSLPHLFCKWSDVQSRAFHLQMCKHSFRGIILEPQHFILCRPVSVSFWTEEKGACCLKFDRYLFPFFGPHTSYGACLLTAWNRVLLEKLTISQLVKELPVVWNPKVHFCFYESLPPVPIVSTSYGAL